MSLTGLEVLTPLVTPLVTPICVAFCASCLHIRLIFGELVPGVGFELSPNFEGIGVRLYTGFADTLGVVFIGEEMFILEERPLESTTSELIRTFFVSFVFSID